MAEPRVCVPRSSAKRITFTGGGEMLKLGFLADELVAFIQQHKNERGYINLIVEQRREPSERGDTHSVRLDTWKPSGQSRQQQAAAPAGAPEAPAEPPEETDVPF